MIHIADEQPFDVAAREALLDRVMGRERVLKPSGRLREGRLPAPGLALVARDGDRLVWADDADFDLSRHVVEEPLAEPGGERELAAKIAEHLGRPLDRAHPL
ncbi:MAG: hypothetical protein F9K43_14285, partial [Bauldia sp.]